MTSTRFKSNAAGALADAQLHKALSNVETGFVAKRATAAAAHRTAMT